MAVRIVTGREANLTVFRVDGYLTVDDIGELDREYRSAEGPRVIDLSNLQSADAEGVKCLRELILLGAEIRGTSPYIELLLQDQP